MQAYTIVSCPLVHTLLLLRAGGLTEAAGHQQLPKAHMRTLSRSEPEWVQLGVGLQNARGSIWSTGQEGSQPGMSLPCATAVIAPSTHAPCRTLSASPGQIRPRRPAIEPDAP